MVATYKSKVDTWFIVLLLVAMAVSVYASISVIMSGASDHLWMGFVTIGLGIGLPLWLLVSTRYTLDTKLLTVRSGPLKWRIPVKDINAITPTRNFFSSPALSLDRLLISYGNSRSLMISPRDKAQFLKEIGALRKSGGRELDN